MIIIKYLIAAKQLSKKMRLKLTKDLLVKRSQKVRKEKEMKLLIEIPTEFESHFNFDRFKDSLERLGFDANYLAGNYEKELAAMLIESFQNALSIEPEIVRCMDGDQVNINVIPISWIDKHIAWLEGLDNPFSTMTAIDIKVMVKRWKEENERINKEHRDAKKSRRE